MQALHILRNLYFISSRTGQNASSQQTFVFLTAIDILSQYPDLADNFLRSIKPADLGQIPAHPVERCLDLFFLNTAEHFPVVMSPEANEELLLSAAFPYLAAGANSSLLEIFEAAHSLVLVVFAVPGNAELAAKHLPFYIDNLFAVSLTLYNGPGQYLIRDRSFPKTYPRDNSASLSKQSSKSLPLHHHLQIASRCYHQFSSRWSEIAHCSHQQCPSPRLPGTAQPRI